MPGRQEAAQAVHAALLLAGTLKLTPEELIEAANTTTVVLELSDRKFGDALQKQADTDNVHVIYEDTFKNGQQAVTAAAYFEKSDES